MRHYTHLFQHNDGLKVFAKQINTENASDILIQIFSGIVSEAHIVALQSACKELLPGAKIIGCTTAGEILNDKTFEHSTLISVAVFEYTSVRTCVADNPDPFKAGAMLALNLKAQDTVAAVCFSSGCHENKAVSGWPYIEGFNSVTPYTPIIGGAGGDNGMFMQSYVFDGDKIVENGIAGAGLYSQNLKITTTFNLGWRPIGKKFKVTGCHDNILESLDHLPAAELVKKYFGTLFTDNVAGGMNFPLYASRSQIRIARGITDVNSDGSITLTAPLEPGESVRFSYGGAEIMLSNRRKIIPRWKLIPADGIFMYSCGCRKWSLPQIVEEEVEMFYSGVPTAGFFSYGEFLYSGQKNEYINYTQTLVGMKEYDVPIGHRFEILLKSEAPEGVGTDDALTMHDGLNIAPEHRYLQVMDHLVGVMNDELMALNRLLEQRNEQLKKSLEEIKTIKGLLPICSNCKKIRNDDGYWEEVETYFREHTDAEFSHGVCPDCFRELYPEMDIDKIYGDPYPKRKKDNN